MKTLILRLTPLILALCLSQILHAIRFESGDNVRIAQPVNEDIYVAAGTVSIDAIVRGDLFAVGGNINVNDTITGDLAVAGGTVYVRGAILDDLRCAGGTLYISGNVAGDLLVTGGTVTLEPGATIGGDVYVAGGVVLLHGTIRGNLKTGSGEVSLDGSVGKSAEFIGQKVTVNGSVGGETTLTADKLTLGPNAAFNGNVRYWTTDGEVDFGSALKSGATARFDPSLEKKWERQRPHFLGFASVMAVIWYLLAMFILLAVVLRLFPNLLKKAAETAQTDPVRALGYGFLYFVAVPVVLVLCMATVIGIPLALIGLFFYILFLTLANIITALVATNWLNIRQNFNWSFWRMVLVALGVLVLFKLFWFIPFVGWLAKILVVCVAFGAIILKIRNWKLEIQEG